MNQIPKEFKQFNYHGVYLGAFTNTDGEIKKFVGRPMGSEIGSIKHYIPKLVYVKFFYKELKPNGINIDCREYSTIDVDEPENCDILERLLEVCTFYVKTNRGFHFYFKKESKLTRNLQLGVVDVNKDNLFFVPTYKHYETGEEFHYTLVKSGELIDMPDFAIAYVNSLVAFKKSKHFKEAVGPKESKFICGELTLTNVPIETFEVITKILYENGDFNDFGKWSKAGFALKHLNNNKEAFEIFAKYSKMVDKYKNATTDDIIKGFTRKYSNEFDIVPLFMKCRMLNKEVFNAKLRPIMVRSQKFSPIEINARFLNMDIVDEWKQSDTKFLVISSSYGTGKTQLFKDIMKKYYPKKTDERLLTGLDVGQQILGDNLEVVKVIKKESKVLFINCRKSLTQSQTVDFANLGFKTYLETPKEEWSSQNLFICQLDSIHHLASVEFDLIVCDEIESLLAHFSFDKLNQTVIHACLMRFLSRAKKVLAMDGDVGARTYDFISTLPDSPKFKFYKNVFKPNKKHFVVWNKNDIDEYVERIESDLAAGEKVVLICMDKGDSNMYYERFSKNYKAIVHNSKERNAVVLRDVKRNWATYQIVIYSPTIENGVDFSELDVFTRCYAMISTGSTSVRGLFQMLSRVRHFKDHTINVYNSMPTFITNALLVDFNTMRENKYQFVPELNNLVRILIHNDVEYQNSKDFFTTVFVDMLESKGHTYELRAKKIKAYEASTSEEKRTLEMAEIMGARDIDQMEYDTLMVKVFQNKDLTRAQNNEVLKCLYKKRFCLDELNEENFGMFYGQFNTLFNWNKLTATYKTEPAVDKYLKHIDYDTTETMVKLIEKLGYTFGEDKKIKSKGDGKKWLGDIESATKEMLNQKNVMLLLGSVKHITDRTFISTLEKYLQRYGYSFTHSRKTRSKGVNDYVYEIVESSVIKHVIGHIKDIDECCIED